jgi:hypothetical protein
MLRVGLVVIAALLFFVAPALAQTSQTVTVDRVVDGDTIEVRPTVPGTESVRLIGVDTRRPSTPTNPSSPTGPRPARSPRASSRARVSPSFSTGRGRTGMAGRSPTFARAARALRSTKPSSGRATHNSTSCLPTTVTRRVSDKRRSKPGKRSAGSGGFPKTSSASWLTWATG